MYAFRAGGPGVFCVHCSTPDSLALSHQRTAHEHEAPRGNLPISARADTLSLQDTVKTADKADDMAFRLLSIKASSAPRESSGRDWLEYQIGQGDHVIKGYRRGDLKTVRADVEKIVIALNERRHSFKAPSAPKRGGPRTAQPRPESQEADE